MKGLLFIFALLVGIQVSNVMYARNDSPVKFKKIKKIKKKNPELYSYTEDIKKALEQHDWTTFISYCLEDNYTAQQELGINDQQYIYEMLQINYNNMMDVDIDYKELIQATMGQIKKVTTLKFAFIGRAMLGDSYLFSGEIELENRLRVTFQYELLLLNKNFKLIGSIG